MVLPDTPYFPYYQILDKRMDFQTWWTQYTCYQTDYVQKSDTDFFSYLMESAPSRWYSRLVLNLYTPMARDTIKFFLPLSFDYESFLLGSAIGMFIAFRHFIDYRSCKISNLGPVEGFCTGRNTYFVRKWEKTHINPRKFFEYDRKRFWRKVRMGIPYALIYGAIATFFCHGFFSTSFHWLERPYPLFIGTTFITYHLYLYDEDYIGMDYCFYKHSELYILGILMLYNVCRKFRNFICHVPSRRVLIG